MIKFVAVDHMPLGDGVVDVQTTLLPEEEDRPLLAGLLGQVEQ